MELPLYGGHVAQIDQEDWALVCDRKWHLSSHGYARTTLYEKGKLVSVEYLHRILMGCTKGDDIVVDHINRDRLDCRRGNMRLTTDSGNKWCTPPRLGSETGFKGVRKNAGCSTFNSCIQHQVLGYFDTAELAALAYDQEARIRFGDMAWLNFPDVTDYSHVQPNQSKIIGERTSKVVGVSYSHKRKGKQKWRCTWRAKHLGWFITEQEAVEFLQKVKNENQIS